MSNRSWEDIVDAFTKASDNVQKSYILGKRQTEQAGELQDIKKFGYEYYSFDDVSIDNFMNLCQSTLCGSGNYEVRITIYHVVVSVGIAEIQTQAGTSILHPAIFEGSRIVYFTQRRGYFSTPKDALGILMSVALDELRSLFKEYMRTSNAMHVEVRGPDLGPQSIHASAEIFQAPLRTTLELFARES